MKKSEAEKIIEEQRSSLLDVHNIFTPASEHEVTSSDNGNCSSIIPLPLIPPIIPPPSFQPIMYVGQ